MPCTKSPSPEPKKYVYMFEEGDWRNKKLFGGKGASLIQMTQLGLPVPPGFTITTEACRDFYAPAKEELDKLVKELERQPPPEIRDKIIKRIWEIIDTLDLPKGLMEQVVEYMHKLEEKTGKKFGSPENPLLVSVRSGAAVSMPGMMDTVLNLGLNDETTKGLANLSQNEWFAYDAYRRFLNMFGRIVLGIDEELFNKEFEKMEEEFKKEAEEKYKDELEAIRKKYPQYVLRLDAQPPKDVAPNLWRLSVEYMKELVEKYKELIKREWGKFPQDPWEQLRLAIKAVFRSWMNPRAIFYRIMNNITPDIADCTAVNIVTMVFGNMGWDSGTGVAFSRDVATGENKLYGEFLPNAQGEDVVAGIRTPMDIEEFRKQFPELYDQLYAAAKLLEWLNKEVQDVEFTVERGKLYLLQTRNAKMTPLARVKTAVELATKPPIEDKEYGKKLIEKKYLPEKEGKLMIEQPVIDKEEAVLKVKPEHVLQLLYPRIDPKAKATPVAKGLPASPGAVSGQAVFDPDRAVEWAREGKRVILVRIETKPDDVHGFYAAVGILTSRGGMTSHAAVVARAIGKPSVVGAEDIVIDYNKREFRIRGKDIVVKEGDWITIDGNTGYVYVGKVPTIEPEIIPELDTLMKWADEARRLGVRANADIPEDARLARKFGAEGIGLLRIERMFRKPERLEVLRKVILAENTEDRKKALEDLVPMIRQDFKEMLEIMDGLPVVIRLIDPPLHEFLPAPEELLQQIYEAKMKGAPKEEIVKLEWLYKRVTVLKEANPMMGHRGVRVGVTYPEIYYALARAMIEAAAELIKEGKNPKLEIMVPQVAEAKEIEFVKKHAIEPALRDVAKKYGFELIVKGKPGHYVFKTNDGKEYEILVGTMIETVRACLTADEIAKHVAFFSFGTNDLTQATFSFSRDDAENKFLPQYLELEILPANPFQTLDIKGVGKLVEVAVNLARKANPDIELGICGEHGGDPRSIEFLHKVGLDYVSASPFRVLIARLAAAQAAIKEKKGK